MNILLILLFVSIAVVVQRNNGILLAEGPPPSESELSVEFYSAFTTGKCIAKRLNELENFGQWFPGSAIVWRHWDITAKLEHRFLRVGIQTGLFEDQHSIGLAENVVVECALRNVVARWGLGEAEFLRNYSCDCFTQLNLRPGRCFQLQEVWEC